MVLAKLFQRNIITMSNISFRCSEHSFGMFKSFKLRSGVVGVSSTQIVQMIAWNLVNVENCVRLEHEELVFNLFAIAKLFLFDWCGENDLGSPLSRLHVVWSLADDVGRSARVGT